MREARGRRWYRCCGWISPTLACTATFPLGAQDGPDDNRARARAAGWFVWTPGAKPGGGICFCPQHREDQPARAGAEGGNAAKEPTGGAAFPPGGALPEGR